ncbi:MAG: ComEC/Rec2 family competence protein [Candidatus Anstonellaceae archaeon]
MKNFNFLFISTFLFILVFLFGCLGQTQPQSEEVPYVPKNINQTQPQEYPTTPQIQKSAYPLKNFELSFLNVGFGDATLILSKNKTILIDVGPANSINLLFAELQRRDIKKIDLLVLSALHDQTFSGGLKDILTTYEIDEIWLNSKESFLPYLPYISNKTTIKEVSLGSIYTFENLKLVVLNPSEGKIYNPDADSIVLKISYNDLCAILFSKSEASGASTSDPGTVFGGVDNKIILKAREIQESLRCDILKVSNHGSGNAASFQLLDEVKPKIAIISVGPNEQKLYPNPTTLRRLALKSIPIYTTNRLGSIIISSKDGIDYTINTDFPYDIEYAKFLNEVIESTRPYWG